MILERLFSDVSPDASRILEAVLDGRELATGDAAVLLRAEGADLYALMRAADVVRRQDTGDDVSFVINRNINFTNICYVGCSFCGFSRHKDDGDAFDCSMDVLIEKARNAVARGATEVCIQGGIHPDKDHTHYREILVALKKEFPELHIHAYSPEEIDFGQRQSGMELRDYLRWLLDAGLGSIPGTAAEILDDEVRDVVSPKKLKTARWIEIIEAAHAVGLPSTSTVMYGHIETVEHLANHLALIRDIQKRTGGFTEFIPLGFVHERNILFNHMNARPGASMLEDLRLVAVSRLFLRPWIKNVQMSWVKMGTKLAQMALLAGANDMGGTLMEESISRESGSQHGENLPPEEMRRLIREVGRTPVQRSTTYEILDRFDDPALDPPALERRWPRDLSGRERRPYGSDRWRASRSSWSRRCESASTW